MPRLRLLLFTALLAVNAHAATSTTAVSRTSSALRTAPRALAATNLVTRPPQVRSDAVTMELDRTMLRGLDLTVLSRNPSGTLSTAAVVRPVPGETTVRVPPLSQAVVFSGSQSSTGRLAVGRAAFPGKLLVATKPDHPRQGSVFLEPRTTPLPWDGKAKAYATRLVVGLDMSDALEPVELTPPVVIQFFAARASVVPPSVTLTRSGAGGYQEVELACLRTAANPEVTARSDFGELTRGIPVESLGVLGLLEGILPLRSLLVALFGGALGGLLRTADRRRSWDLAQVVNFLWQGALVGLVTVCAISAGLGFAGIAAGVVGADVGVFSVSALAGLAGVALLHKLKRKAFGADAP
jgi:hypothetical protein